MKKLLALVLILAMASLASATVVDLTVGGSTEYSGTAGETITVSLVADLQVTAFGIGAVAETDASLNQILIGAAGGSVGGTEGTLDALTAGTGVTITSAGWVNNYLGLLFDIGTGYGDSAAGAVIASFSYTIASDWDGTDYYVAPLAAGTTYEYMSGGFEDATLSYATLIVGSDPTNIEIGGLHIVPEPMTFGLLGLGGLFLRRRKK